MEERRPRRRGPGMLLNAPSPYHQRQRPEPYRRRCVGMYRGVSESTAAPYGSAARGRRSMPRRRKVRGERWQCAAKWNSGGAPAGWAVCARQGGSGVAHAPVRKRRQQRECVLVESRTAVRR